MDKIGTRIVIAQRRFLIPLGETAEFVVEYNDTALAVKLELHRGMPENFPEKDATATVKWRSTEEGIRIYVYAMDPRDLKGVVGGVVGQFGRRELSFNAALSADSRFGDIFIQFTVEEVPNA